MGLRASSTIWKQKTKYVHGVSMHGVVFNFFFKALNEFGGDIPQPATDKLFSLAEELIGVSK